MNKDLVVDLSNNKIEYLLGKSNKKPFWPSHIKCSESDIKSYIETRKRKGFINLSGNRLRCQCDLRWLLALNYQWADLLQNAVCKNGQTLAEVGSPDYTAEYVVLMYTARLAAPCWRTCARLLAAQPTTPCWTPTCRRACVSSTPRWWRFSAARRASVSATRDHFSATVSPATTTSFPMLAAQRNWKVRQII